jgi:hypothetical protein
VLTIPQLQARIRFELEQLSAQNAQFEFEHLCRQLARNRICSNILPASGPVGAGGDQTRDFETFTSHLTPGAIPESTFLGLLSDKPIAFTCSLREDFAKKIKADVTALAGSVATIHSFSSRTVPVATRHKLQKWAKDKHTVTLEIHDAESISELLSDRDVFWIAIQYLRLAAEDFPRSDRDSERQWYIDLLKKWQQTGRTPATFADFYELKSGVREATFEESIKQDLPFWLSLLKRLAAQPDNAIARLANYEIAVAALRGLNEFRPEEDRVRTYMASADGVSETRVLRDASVLAMYVAGARLHAATDISSDELTQWVARLANRLDELLTTASGPGYRCELLSIRAFHYLVEEAANATPGSHRRIPEPALDLWVRLLKLVPKAPLFPLDTFADHLTRFIELFGTTERLDAIAQRTDKLLARRSGKFVAAAKCMDRALALYERGEKLAALNQLHQAKVDWFAAETLRQSIRAMRFIAGVYRDLRLHYAQKYYALAAASLAINANEDKVKLQAPKAAWFAADADYAAGQWAHALNLFRFTLILHSHFASDPGNLELHEHFLEPIVYSTALIHAIADRLDPAIGKVAHAEIAELRIDDLLEGILPSAQQTWGAKSTEEIAAQTRGQLSGAPFNDIARPRRVSWCSLGLNWELRWDRLSLGDARAEEFAALAQIVLADLSSFELFIPATTVELALRGGSGWNVESVADNDRSRFVIQVPTSPKADDVGRAQAEAVAVLTYVLSTVSLAPTEAVLAAIRQSHKAGLPAKAFVGRSYTSLYADFYEKSRLDVWNALEHSFNPPRVPVDCVEELKWRDALLPSYDRAEHESVIRKRYVNSRVVVRFTLERLNPKPEWQAILRFLREEGWLDWHVLTGLAMLVANWRVNSNPATRLTVASDAEGHMKRLMADERRDDPEIPIAEITIEGLRRHLQMSMLSTAKALKFEMKMMTPNLDAIQKFLWFRGRYGFDDVPHPDPFDNASLCNDPEWRQLTK